MREEEGALNLAADCGGRKDAPLPSDVVGALERSPNTTSIHEISALAARLSS